MGVTAIAQLIGPASKILGGLGGLFGSKPDLRPAREDELFAMVANREPYALEAARIIWWRHSNAGSKADGAENAVVWSKLQAQFPDLASQAMAAGPLTDTTSQAPHVPVTGSYRPGAFPSSASYDAAASQVAQGVQQLGTGLTNAATHAIAPNGGQVAIGTNINTLVLLALGVLVLVLLIRRGGR